MIDTITLPAAPLAHSKQPSDRLQAELDHRVKNMLAMVQSFAHQTLKHAQDFDDFKIEFLGRVNALAHLQNLLTRNHWSGDLTHHVVEAAVKPYVKGKDQILIMRGATTLFLRSRITQALFLVLHELTANSARYGALSHTAGRVEIEWELHNESMQITWREQCCSTPATPPPGDFGNTLMRLCIESELGGELVQRFEKDGFRCDMQFPLLKSENINPLIE
jgi:two-component sensor histidine kinase